MSALLLAERAEAGDGGGLLAQVAPIHVGTEFLAAHRAVGSALDGWTQLRRNWSITSNDLADELR